MTPKEQIQLERAARRALFGQRSTIQIGRNRNSAGVTNHTWVLIVEGDQPPTLEGRPYLSTNFVNGSFSKRLYTPSTLRIVVGANWKP